MFTQHLFSETSTGLYACTWTCVHVDVCADSQINATQTHSCRVSFT